MLSPFRRPSQDFVIEMLYSAADREWQAPGSVMQQTWLRVRRQWHIPLELDPSGTMRATIPPMDKAA